MVESSVIFVRVAVSMLAKDQITVNVVKEAATYVLVYVNKSYLPVPKYLTLLFPRADL